MRAAQTRHEDSEIETQDEQAEAHMLHALPASQPARLPGKSTNGARIPRPRHKFAPGNKFGGRRKPVDVILELDRTLKDALARLRTRNYEFEIDATGQQVRVERPLDAARGNAIANLVRARLEIHAQYAVGELVRRQQAELEQLRGVVAQLLEARS